jgi:hypothetical protein
MSKMDSVSKNTKPLPEQVGGNKGDIDYLMQLISDLQNRVQELERKNIGASTAIARINGHSSAMPDYKGENTDHDARYVRISDFKQWKNTH